MLVARGLPYSVVTVSYKNMKLVVDKNRQRAISILLFLGGILALMATWNLPAIQ
jgi:hypothetical protein